jgi:glycosyltransferase involved in cell wall biosynthesis
MNNYNVRVIVPCYNSDSTVEKCISSILDSEGIEFELYVVDDGNNNELASLMKSYPIKVLTTGGQKGAGKARNIGTGNFNGQIVVFIDSDVQVHPDTIASLIEPITENEADATAGSYSKVRCKNFYDTYKNFYLAYRYNTEQTYLSYTFWSAICALNYNTYTKIKGFKECYSGAGPEDIDMGVDLSSSGARILSVPKASGIHLSVLSFFKLIKNDLRKGSEDIYIHWSRKVPITCNRHVNKLDLLAVLLACCIAFLLAFLFIFGFKLLLIFVLLYLIARIRFVKDAFGENGVLFIIRSFFLTYLLDVIRGFAVINGTSLFLMEMLSSGKYKPFMKLSY